jgi:hypothetical protein
MSYIYSLDVYHSLGENTNVDDHQTFMTSTKKKTCDQGDVLSYQHVHIPFIH